MDKIRVYKGIKQEIVEKAIIKRTVNESMINVLEKHSIITEKKAQRKRQNIDLNFSKIIDDTYRKTVIGIISKKVIYSSTNNQKRILVKKCHCKVR